MSDKSAINYKNFIFGSEQSICMIPKVMIDFTVHLEWATMIPKNREIFYSEFRIQNSEFLTFAK